MSERKIGTDGELLQDFKSSTNSQNIEEIRKSIEQNQKNREKAFLGLMKSWEQKKRTSGFSKEFSTLGRWKDRIVVCANPCVEEWQNSDDLVKLRYLAITRKGFSIFEFRGLSPSYALNYAIDPFIPEIPLIKFGASSNYDRDHDLFIFHSLLKGDFPSNRAKWDFKVFPSAEVRIKDKESIILGIKHYGGLFNFESKAIEITEALGIFNGVQNRVKDVVTREVEELNKKFEESYSKVQALNMSFGDEIGKRKNR